MKTNSPRSQVSLALVTQPSLVTSEKNLTGLLNLSGFFVRNQQPSLVNAF